MEQRPTIPRSEFVARVENVRREMSAAQLDACFVYGDEYRREYLRYVSNFWPIFERGATLIPHDGEPILIAAPEGEEVAREMSAWHDIRLTMNFACVTVPDHIDYPLAELTTFDAIFSELRGRQPLRRLGVAGLDAMSPTVYWALQTALPSVELVDANHILVKLRLLKSANEIACLQEAGRIADVGYENLMAASIPSNTERQAAAAAEGAARAAGAEFVPFTIFASGQRTNSIVGRASEKVIAEGDMLMAALAVQYEGYVATVEFPFVVGDMTPAQRGFIDALIVAEARALPSLRAGTPEREFVRKVKEHFAERGLAQYDVYPPLHGIGYAEAEAPYPDSETATPFLPGMAVNTDISLFRSPVGSNRIEEGFVVREGEPLPLSPLVRRLCTAWLGG